MYFPDITSTPLLTPISNQSINWASYDHELTQWKTLLEEVKDNSHFHLDPEKISLNKWKQFFFKNGASQWIDGRRDRNLFFFDSYKRIISNLFSTYVSDKASIIELGSNQIINNESSLSEIIPEKYKTDFVYSDRYKCVVKGQKTKTDRKYLLINATKLSTQLTEQQENTKDVIVSLNVLGVINRRKFFKIAQQAYAALNPNGLFMALSDHEAHHHPLMDCEESKVAIPWRIEGEDTKQMISISSRQQFLNNVKNALQDMPQKYKLFFNDFSSLTMLQQRIFLAQAYQSNKLSLLHLLKSFLPFQEITTFDIDESYSKEAVNALKEAGFEILLTEQIADENTIFGGFQNGHNYIENKVGKVITRYNEKVSDGQILSVSKINVILAKK